MKVIICGAGDVGTHTADVLTAAGHNVTVLDLDGERVRSVADTLDVGTLVGDCAHAEVLRSAGCEDADLLVAASNVDEINMFTASIAKEIGAKKTIARIHRAVFFEEKGLDYQKHFNIDHVICPEFSTATAIARIMRNPAAMAIEHFAHGRIDMQEFPVSSGASALGKTLRELGLPQGIRLAAVTRGKEVLIPDASTAVKPGDRIVLVTNSGLFYDTRKMFHPDESGRRKVVIMGGPIMAIWLCHALRGRNWSIRLFEHDRNRAEELAEMLDWVTVLNADPTDHRVYEEEQLGQADVFIAMRDDDEDNIIGGVLAKTLGVTQVFAVVQRSHYMDLLYHIGVDRAFSPRVVAAKEIENILDVRPLKLLASLSEGAIDAYEVRVGPKADVAGKQLKDIKIASNWVLAAIRRGEEIWVPGADDEIQSSDTVLVIGRHGMEKDLEKLFLTK